MNQLWIQYEWICPHICMFFSENPLCRSTNPDYMFFRMRSSVAIPIAAAASTMTKITISIPLLSPLFTFIIFSSPFSSHVFHPTVISFFFVPFIPSYITVFFFFSIKLNHSQFQNTIAESIYYTTGRWGFATFLLKFQTYLLMIRRFSIKKEGIPKGMPSHCLYIKSRSGDNTFSADYLLGKWD